MAVVCATSSDAGHPRFIRYLSAWGPPDGLAKIVKTVPLLPANCNLIQLLSPCVTNNATISEGSTDTSKLQHAYRVSPRYYILVRFTRERTRCIVTRDYCDTHYHEMTLDLVRAAHEAKLSATPSSVSQPPGRGPVPGPGINYTGPREILLELITNLNVILYLSTCHTVHVIVPILSMIMP